MTRSALVDVLVGGTQVLAVAVTAPLGRGRYNRWGATDAEVRAAMPGDDLVASPRLGYTRALSIAAPVERVWPWLVQMGQGRGGLYSFDALENLVGCDIHSVDRIMPEFQALDADTGKVLWEYDTIRDYKTVNGAAGRGGAIDQSGVVVVDGWVYVNSGYANWGAQPGNVLLAFKVAK